MAILHGTSGLPEDRYVNTFWFRQPEGSFSTAQAADTIADRLQAFYEDAGVGLNPLTWFLSNQAIDEARGLEVRVYDTDEVEPRTPYTEQRSLTGFVATVPLPNEVAVVLSYYATRNIPRRRGRVYIGPLNLNALSTTENDGDGTPPLSLRQALQWAAETLSGYEDMPWSVASRKDGVLRTITNGWVDNAFDTQRRRGVQANLRTLWSKPTF
jgi:hypothetical protein